MTIDVYKIKRKTYKIVVFSREHGLETYLVEGKKKMKTKVTLLKKLDRKKGSFDILPRPFQVLKDGKLHLQFANEKSQVAALQFCQKTDPNNKEKYKLNKE